jgi:hypothetical protein
VASDEEKTELFPGWNLMTGARIAMFDDCTATTRKDSDDAPQMTTIYARLHIEAD